MSCANQASCRALLLHVAFLHMISIHIIAKEVLEGKGETNSN
jgi:hypothetical protein